MPQLQLQLQTIHELLANCIGNKQFSVLSKTTGEDLVTNIFPLSEELSTLYHIVHTPTNEVKDWTGSTVRVTDIYVLYRRKDWLESQERAANEATRKRQEREDFQQRQEKVEIFKQRMKEKGKQPSEIVSLLEKIFTYKQPYYNLGVKYQLINPATQAPVVEKLDEMISRL